MTSPAQDVHRVLASSPREDRALLRDMARDFGAYHAERHRGKVRHRLTFWVNGQRHRVGAEPTAHGHRRSFRSKAHALEVLEEIRAEVRHGRSPMQAIAPYLDRHNPEVQIQTWTARWVREMRRMTVRGERSPTYLRELVRYTKSDGHFSFWNDFTLWEPRYALLEDWNEWLASERGLGPKTRKNVLGAFRSFLGWLVKREEIQSVPVFPEIVLDECRPHILSAKLQTLLLEAIPEASRGIFLAMGRLGLRPGEARALDAGDFRDGWITVNKAVKGLAVSSPIGPTKTKRERRIPAYKLAPDLCEWMEQHVPARDRLKGIVPMFRNPETDSRWSHWALYMTWDAARTEVGVNVKLYEATRHTFATNLLATGVRRDVVQRLLGHTSDKMTERYAQWTDDAVIEGLK